MSKELALKICNDVHTVVNQIEEDTINQSILDINSKQSFKLYKCDLHTLTNTMMIVTPQQKIFFTPFTVLSYFKIQHKETCEMMYTFLQKQMSNSKLLATSGEKDRTLFFKTIHSKIDLIKERINLDYKMGII